MLLLVLPSWHHHGQAPRESSSGEQRYVAQVLVLQPLRGRRGKLLGQWLVSIWTVDTEHTRLMFMLVHVFQYCASAEQWLNGRETSADLQPHARQA